MWAGRNHVRPPRLFGAVNGAEMQKDAGLRKADVLFPPLDGNPGVPYQAGGLLERKPRSDARCPHSGPDLLL